VLRMLRLPKGAARRVADLATSAASFEHSLAIVADTTAQDLPEHHGRVSKYIAVLRRAEGREPTELRELVGRRARVVVSIEPAGRGMVSLTYDGALQTLPAESDAAIARGRQVEILGVRGMGVTVRSLPPP